tara:strand:- start:19246 stop:19443 length:198 start_codon:yes stop_codon:yes gene_type:complete
MDAVSTEPQQFVTRSQAKTSVKTFVTNVTAPPTPEPQQIAQLQTSGTSSNLAQTAEKPTANNLIF